MRTIIKSSDGAQGTLPFRAHQTLSYACVYVAMELKERFHSEPTGLLYGPLLNDYSFPLRSDEMPGQKSLPYDIPCKVKAGFPYIHLGGTTVL